jgi:hypothetical protein
VLLFPRQSNILDENHIKEIILRRKFAFVVSWIIGISVFICWMILVGNPHVTETIIGLVISSGIGMWINNKIDPLDI